MTRIFWFLFRRGLLGIARRPVTLTFGFLQPLLWMLLFGFLFERMTDERQLQGLSYLTFVAPGVSLMSVLFGASQSGVPLIRDYQTGYLQRMARTPTTPAALLAGKLAADCARLFAQALGVLLMGAALGAKLQLQPRGLPLALGAVGLLSIALTSISCLLALLARAPEPMGVYVHLANMPLLFTSTALVPRARMVPWLESLSRVNPLSAAVDAWRAAWVGTPIPPGHVLVLPLLMAVSTFLAATFALSAVRLRR